MDFLRFAWTSSAWLSRAALSRVPSTIIVALEMNVNIVVCER